MPRRVCSCGTRPTTHNKKNKTSCDNILGGMQGRSLLGRLHAPLHYGSSCRCLFGSHCSWHNVQTRARCKSTASLISAVRGPDILVLGWWYMMTERRGSVFHCEEQGKGRGKWTVTVDSQASTAAPYALPATGSVSSSGNTYSHGPRRLGRRLPLHLAVADLAAADGEQACERGGTRECGAWQCEWIS